MPSRKKVKKSSPPLPPPKKVVKSAKKVAKETKKQSKQIGKTVKALSKAIKNLAPKKKASKKAAKKRPAKVAAKKVATKKVAAKTTKLKRRPSYTLQTLAGVKSKSLAKLLPAIEARADQIDALKSDDQFFALSIYGRNVLVPFESSSGITERLNQYIGVWDADLVSHIHILTKGEPGVPLEKSERSYREEIEAGKAETRRMNREMESEVRASLGSKTATGQRKSKTQLLSEAFQAFKKSTAEAEAARKRAEEAEKRIGILEAAVAKLLKPATKKKAAKKVVTKKKAAKKVAKKVAKKSTKKGKANGTKAKTKPTRSSSTGRASGRATAKSNAKSGGSKKTAKTSTKKVSAKRRVRK